jgi:3-oxoacyl-[acyl-carrier protein] reductase
VARLTTLSRSVAGARVLVTGAASGMGRATAQLFADEGARVAVVDIGEERVNRAVAEIQAVHGAASAAGFSIDVADPVQLDQLIDVLSGYFGGIDVLVNNAGISMVSSAFSPDDDFEHAWARTLDVNLTAHARLIRRCLPWLREAPNGGRVVNIASTEGIIATGGLAAYTASKHGVIGLTKSFAVELGRLGITVNCVCPGPIATAMTEAIPAADKEVYAKRRVPLRRYGDPEEVAHMTLSLCLPAASFVNGAVVVVDGGLTIRH